MWSNISFCTGDEIIFNSLTAGGKESYTQTSGVEVSTSNDLTEDTHKSKSSKRDLVLQSIMKQSTETYCTSTKKRRQSHLLNLSHEARGHVLKRTTIPPMPTPLTVTMKVPMAGRR